jgi:hypothetical protein
MEPTAILPKEEPTPIAAPCAIAAPRPENIPPPPAVQVKIDIVKKYAEGLGRRLFGVGNALTGRCGRRWWC